MYRNYIKGLLDKVISFLLLIIFFIPGITLVLILLITQGIKGVFFIQNRPGQGEIVFKLLKFKTMSDQCGPDGNLLPDADRITPLGTFMRKTSLDELPQLWNVLKGEMSLVGPRPLLVDYLSLYNELQKRRHNLKPGITGWAQVNGRNLISWHQKFEYDVWYVDNCSFLLDLKILWLTLVKVFKYEGINQKGQATAESFLGND